MQRRRFSPRKLWGAPNGRPYGRRLALFFTTVFCWTFILSPGATAFSQRPTPTAKRQGAGFRRLSAAEMSHIRGSLHTLSVSEYGGANQLTSEVRSNGDGTG